MANSFIGGLKVRRIKVPMPILEAMEPEYLHIQVPNGQTLSVKEGDSVGRGAMIAASCGEKAARYTGLGGTIRTIRESDTGTTVTVTHQADIPAAEALPPMKGKLSEMTEETLTEALLSRGVVPPKKGEKAMKCLIVDCSGDDPFNLSPAALCLGCGGDVVGGAKILMKLLSVRRCLFAVSLGQEKVADELNSYIPAGSQMLKVELVKSKFPQSVPHLLVSTLFNLEINSGIPLEKTGYTVISPALCKAAFDALAKGIPYTDGLVTVSREGRPADTVQVLTVPFGTELEALLDACQTLLAEEERLTTGGGYRAVPADRHTMVTPETEAVVILSSAKKAKKRVGVCIGCHRCDDVCPMRLMPSLLYEAAMSDRKRQAERLDIETCIGCGACTAVCPSGLPLAEAITAYLTELSGEMTDEGS